ncbi:MAG: tetratricopeptide repeat protein [Actinomycetota bacterium]
MSDRDGTTAETGNDGASLQFDTASEELWGKTITALIVAATLLAAFVGYLLTAASREGTAVSLKAERLASRSMSTLLDSQSTAQVSYEAFVKTEEQRQHAANALQSWLLSKGRARRNDRLVWSRWTQLASSTQRRSSIDERGPDGPENDKLFPQRFFNRATFPALRMGAEQDAANEANNNWERHTAPYTAILALLAISLYMLGFALAMSAAVKRLFMTTGICLLALGSVWAAIVWASPVRAAPDSSAREFAAGLVASKTATDRAGFQAAVRDFDRAIELRPTFARAYVERAFARFLVGSPQKSAYRSLTTRHALEGAIDDFETAVDLGANDFRVLWNLGFDQYLLGLQESRPDLIEEAIATTQLAIEKAPYEPNLRFNLGVALLAHGQPAAARSAYRAGVFRTVYTDVAKRVPRNDRQDEEDIVAGALTDLQFLVDNRPDLAPEVRSLKGYVVGSVAGGAAMSGPIPTLEGRVHLYPSGMWITSPSFLDGISSGVAVSVQWYYRDPQKLGWSILPSVSSLGPRRGGDDGAIGDFSSLLASAGDCLNHGSTYRAEVYVGGQLVTPSLEQVWHGPDSVPLISPVVNTALCFSNGWTRPRSIEPVRGAVDGFTDAEAHRGVYVIRANLPISEMRAHGWRRTARMAELALRRLRPYIHVGAPLAAPVAAGNFIADVAAGTSRYFAYGHGLAYVDAGTTRDDGLEMIVVVGPRSDFPSGASRILESAQIYERTGLAR